MEVHAHSHSPGKKWTHYLWEFLMLFLAVFCGFLAENFREHQVEHQREKQYIKTMIANLKDDTISVKAVMKTYEKKLEFLDSLLSIRSNDFSVATNSELFYYYSLKTLFNNNFFQSNDATLIQLRNSGGLRLIRVAGASDSITLYQKKIETTMAHREALDRYFIKTNHLLEKMIDETMFFDTIYFKDDWFTEKAHLSITGSKQQLKEFFNSVQVYKLIARVYLVFFLQGDLNYAERLITFLEEKYHLK